MNRHGPGIRIDSSSNIWIKYWNDDTDAPGNYITIYYGGEFIVGEYIMKDGRLGDKFTQYNTDGTSKKFIY